MRHIGLALLFPAAAAVLILVGCGGGKPDGNLAVDVSPSDWGTRGFELIVQRGGQNVLNRPLAPLEATLPPGRYRISIVWNFRGDPHGPPTYLCGSRRVTIRRNVRVDVFVKVESLERCPIELGGTG